MSSEEAKIKKQWELKQLAHCRLPDLKQYLKSVSLPMNGDAMAVAKRVGMHMDVKYLDLFVMQDGKKTTPFELKPAQLRKIVADLGKDPTGDKDELHSSLIDHLKKKSKAEKPGSSGTAAATDESKGVILAKQILEMQTEYVDVLSASGINITTDSSVATMRKAYLKLSLLIHPDKLTDFSDATKAFQCLVNAYERLSQPELFLDEEDDVPEKKKAKKIVRSNEGCFRTKLLCPRCNAEWGLPDSGVEAYDYNFMMMGLKSFNCAGCLFDFGCMTAIHKCPFCKKGFEYHPSDYHRKITCSNTGKCGKLFGFQIFHISERMEKEYRAEIRKKQEKMFKEKEQQAEREKRSKSRLQTGIGSQGKEKLFVMNLLDACPRCGDEVEGGNQEMREDHLKNCKDKTKIAAYAKLLKEQQDLGEKKKKMREAEAEVQNAQSWDYLGGKTSELWLLSETQLRNMCEEHKLGGDGTKDELIAKIVKHKNSLDSKRMLTQGETGDVDAPARKKMKITAEDLPANMESMSVVQLKSVCTAFGIVPNKSTKSGIIDQIEKLVHGDEPFLRLTDGKEKKK